MFGVIVAGRLVQTDFQQVSEMQFLITIPDADNVNHLVVFLTGVQAFPEAMGGSVYFSWPDPENPPAWLLLGHISNTKPSAIFKIASLKAKKSTSHPFGVGSISHVAQIGIAIESLSHIALQTTVNSAAPSTIDSFTEFASKMLENFYNYAASFTKPVPDAADSYIPLSCLHQWFQNFQRRLHHNPNFWRN